MSYYLDKEGYTMNYKYNSGCSSSNNNNNNNDQYEKDETYEEIYADDFYMSEISSLSSYSTTNESTINQILTKKPETIYKMVNSEVYLNELVEDYEKIHNRSREGIIHQLYISEIAYVQSLQLLTHLFIHPLKRNLREPSNTNLSSILTLNSKKPICTPLELKWLFANLDDIYQYHKTIAKEMEQKINIGPPVNIFSNMFNNIFTNLGKLYGAYLDNYNTIVTTYERLMLYPPFKKFVEDIHKDKRLKGATLLSLLKSPSNCILRYTQILAALVDVTPSSHPDYLALNRMKKVYDGLNDEIRPMLDNVNNMDKVLLIHQSLVESPVTIHKDRRLVLQANLTKFNNLPSNNVNNTNNNKNNNNKSKNNNSRFSLDGWKKPSVNRSCYLFSDILLCVQEKRTSNRKILQYKQHIPLNQAKVRLLSNKECQLDHCFEIISFIGSADTLNSTLIGTSRSHFFQAQNKDEQEEWYYQLLNVINELGRNNSKVIRK